MGISFKCGLKVEEEEEKWLLTVWEGDFHSQVDAGLLIK